MENILKAEVKKLLINIPQWVDTTKSSHHDLWTLMVEINSNIFYLTKDREIKSEENIIETFDFIESLISVIYEMVEIEDVDLLLYTHYYNILSEIKLISIYLEEYEITNNINSLMILFNNQIEFE